MPPRSEWDCQALTTSSLRPTILLTPASVLDPKLIVPITRYGLPWLGNYIYWCAPSSRTYVSIRYYGSILPASWKTIQDRLKGAFDRTQVKIQTGGDRIILGGFFVWGDEPDTKGIYIRTLNADNHQQTWGVLGAAISALQDFCLTLDNLGIVPRNLEFRIYDGDTQVGTGDLASARVP